MLNPRDLDELTRRIQSRLPPGSETLAAELRDTLREALTVLFARLDLVTREEFEVQAAMLEKAERKLTALEQLLQQLEKERKDTGSRGEGGAGGDSTGAR